MQEHWNYPNPNNPYNPYRQQQQPHVQNQEWNNYTNYNQGQQQHCRQITINEAMNIALAQVPGQIVKVELDTEQGIQVYEVDVVTAQGAKYEVSVDINTGEIIEIDFDR